MAPIVLAYAGLAGIVVSTIAVCRTNHLASTAVRPLLAVMAFTGFGIMGSIGTSQERALHPERHHPLEIIFPVMKPKPISAPTP